MQPVDRLLVNGFVLTMNEEMELFPDGAVAIKGSEIVAVGTTEEITATFQADDVVDCSGKVIMPGLVNSHTHLAMNLMRGLADDLRLDVWLMGYIMPTERQFVDPEFVYLGTKLAAAELIYGGVTAFADMYYFEAEVARAAAEAGLRGICGESVLKFPTPDAESFEASLEYTEKFIQEWKDHPLIIPAVAPHAPYTCTDEILVACKDLAIKYDIPLLIHVSETQQEVEDSREEYGMPVVPRLKKLGVFDHKCLAAHCVHVDTGEIRTMHNHEVGIAHNPTSNLKLASGIAPVQEMLDQGLKVGIGTDGVASNNDLDMFQEMHLAALIAKPATNDPTAVPAKTTLLMATRMGAEACHIGHLTGSLESGKMADIIVVDLDVLHNVPAFRHDPDGIYSQLVYAAHNTDVRHVMCNGQWLMKDRQLLTLDVDSIRQEAQDIALKIDEFLREYSNNTMSKLIAVGHLERQESFEIQLKTRFNDTGRLGELLNHPDVQIIKQSHYKQYDTYFLFNDPAQGRVRYREDDYIDEDGEVSNVRMRLTYTMGTKEREFDKAVLLSHSQFYCPADRPLRFYREYFRATEEREIHKERKRWRILYKGVLFFINLDTIFNPQSHNTYLEVKSRTWSLRDAEYKAGLVSEILHQLLEVETTDYVREDYIEIARDKQIT